MPTPFERQTRGEWAARTDAPRRSVFGNYGGPGSPSGQESAHPDHDARDALLPDSSAVDEAVARAFIYRFLAKACEDPTPDGWAWLCCAETREALRSALECLSIRNAPEVMLDAAKPVRRPALRRRSIRNAPEVMLDARAFESFHGAYVASFGHAARGACPLNEIEYGDIKADPLFQPHRLADLAAFYRAFGLEISEEAGERQDHLSIELEFMCVLAAKEAHALSMERSLAHHSQSRDAQKKFLREHLGRWIPAFARRLKQAASEGALKALAEFLRVFVEADCARFNVSPGSEDLLLRPVDEAAENMCASCGISNQPPGA